jgi:ribA/ribD-fused uncharacterized protein
MSKFKFSNFQPVKFKLENRVWPTVEHFFQAMKSTDPADWEKVRKLDTPGKAKRAGRKLKLRSDWDKVKEDFMMKGLRAKFAIKDHKQSLLSTGDEEIVEWNTWHDNEWGSCTCSRCENRPGKNKLGKLLMRLRAELRSI